MMEPKHANVVVRLTDQDGNAFSILGSVRSAMRNARLPQSEIDTFIHEATRGDYDDLLQTCMKWVTVE